MVIDEKQPEVKSTGSAESATDSHEEPPSDGTDKFGSSPAPDEIRSDRPHANEGAERPDNPADVAEDRPERSPKVAEPAPDEVQGGRDSTAESAPVKRRTKTAHDPDLKRPTHHEILNRLLEKNEVILQLNKKNVQLEAKQKALEDKRIRLVAEFENYRKRTRKEWELLKHQTKAEVFLEILDVVDNFERAFSAVGEKDDDFVLGIRLIYNNMLTVLNKAGVNKMKALHEPFDPAFHMAVAQINSDEAESNHVIEVIQEGYLLNDTVIRPAKVVIAR